MADWKHVIDMSHEHERYEFGEIAAPDVARKLAAQLMESPYHEDLADMICMLSDCEDAEDYDAILEELYDFGDEGHRLFVRTF